MKTRLSLKDRLATQPALLGFMQTHPNPALAEMAGMCGYDFIFMDCEHGLFSEMDHEQTMQVLGSTGTAAVVRLRGHDAQAMGRYMDMGADAIVVPNVTTAEQARMLVTAMHYPPAGTRGFAASAHRVTRYGMDVAAHVKAPREHVALVPIIESGAGVANVDDILAVEGVDGVIIGPSDLSIDLGCFGDYSQAVFTQAVARIEQAARDRGKLLGTAPHAGSPIDVLIGRGHRLFIIGADMPLIREAMSTQVSNARSLLPRPESS